jgi:hypothetical protein
MSSHLTMGARPWLMCATNKARANTLHYTVCSIRRNQLYSMCATYGHTCSTTQPFIHPCVHVLSIYLSAAAAATARPCTACVQQASSVAGPSAQQ